MLNLLKRLFKRPPPTRNHAREVVVNYTTYSTPAQIQSFCEAYFDRQAYRDGRAPEMDVSEPGCEVQLGWLDLTDEPPVVWGKGQRAALTVHLRKPATPARAPSLPPVPPTLRPPRPEALDCGG